MIITRDAARDYFSLKGLRYSSSIFALNPYPIHKVDIDMLYIMCCLHLEGSNCEIPLTMRKNYTVKLNRDKTLKEAYLFCQSDYFKKREAISFNEDGFIGFAGWADNKYVQPFLEAFVEWVDWFVNSHGERASV